MENVLKYVTFKTFEIVRMTGLEPVQKTLKPLILRNFFKILGHLWAIIDYLRTEFRLICLKPAQLFLQFYDDKCSS
mgnify:FL=1